MFWVHTTMQLLKIQRRRTARFSHRHLDAFVYCFWRKGSIKTNFSSPAPERATDRSRRGGARQEGGARQVGTPRAIDNWCIRRMTCALRSLPQIIQSTRICLCKPSSYKVFPGTEGATQRGLQPVYSRFNRGTTAALLSWLLTYVTIRTYLGGAGLDDDGSVRPGQNRLSYVAFRAPGASGLEHLYGSMNKTKS